MESVNTTNVGGTAEIEWVVKDPRKEGEEHDVKLSFEGFAQGQYSQWCEIAVGNSIVCNFSM